MPSKIFLIDAMGTLKPMEETAYESERILQELLEKYPEVLAGQQSPSETNHRWELVSREFGVPGEEGGSGRWSLDHLFLDQEAIPTLVEVKRAKDTRTRREVVAQMLDYAANAVAYWPVEEIRAKLEAACQERQANPDETVMRLLGDHQSETDPVGEFWQRVKTNLQAGRIRMVFVADHVPSELRRIVEFLNEQMDPAEVFAIEVPQFIGENVRALVPTVIGLTEAAQQKKTPLGQSGGRQPNLTYEELDSIAEQNGVGDLYRHAVANFEKSLQTRTTRSTIGFTGRFQDSRKNVLSLVPQESTAAKGLKFQVYFLRLRSLLGLPEEAALSLLPVHRQPRAYFGSPDPDWSGFEGYFTDRSEIDRLAEALAKSRPAPQG